MKKFKSTFAEHLSSYVLLKQRLGLAFETQTYYLQKFDTFVAEVGHRGLLTQQLALDFAATGTTEDAAARKYETVKHFSEYLATVVPGSIALERFGLRRVYSRAPARIFSPRELRLLLREAPAASPRSQIRGAAVKTMIGLAASCGLRPGEVVRLNRADVHFDELLIEIKQTKFKKDRLVPMHATTAKALRSYCEQRDLVFPEPNDAFFLNARGERLSDTHIEAAMRDLLCRLGMRKPTGRGATFGDLRHTFAVNRLIAWYREGVDVQAKLPALATYMGHVDYTSTAYYITMTPELRSLASQRLTDWRRGARKRVKS
ncbi:MAG: tyrosine-type recombinase/integrase [Deltaproteobacteria bacterium]|nr:tyrosine-type recombinase/integrase [Deltaproteobacteria bacterium]